jgi:hypothetical protein
VCKRILIAYIGKKEGKKDRFGPCLDVEKAVSIDM